MMIIHEPVRIFRAGTDEPDLIEETSIERELTPTEVERDAILTDWKARRAELVAAWNDMQANRQAVIDANQQVQGATTTAQLSSAVKANSQAQLVTLGTLEGTTQAIMQMMAVMERAMGWLDGQLAELAENGE